MEVPNKATEIKGLITALLAFFTGLWGWVGWAVVIMVAAMLIDYITGSWGARAHGEWSSAIARQGLWHKLGEIVALLVAALCDIAIKVILSSAAAPILSGFEYRNYITLIVAIWYIFTEAGSIVENAAKLGAPVPKWLAKGIAALQQRADDEAVLHDFQTPDQTP